MDDGGYRIDTDPAGERMRIELRGSWGEPMAACFARDLDAALTAMALAGARPGRHLLTLDLRDRAILSQPMVDRFRALASDPVQAGRRVAVLVQGTLQTMQLRRAAGASRDVRFFLLEDEAEAWLEEAMDEIA